MSQATSESAPIDWEFPRIAVVGVGALGGYYGARLAQAGREVHLIVRSDYEAIKQNGLKVISPGGDFVVQPRLARTAEEVGPVDVVIIGLKTTANDLFSELIPPLLHANTLLLTLQNGLGNEEALARRFGAERVLGGLCFVCINRQKPGVIHHLAHGRILMGEFDRPSAPRTHALAKMFRASGVPCDVEENLNRAHWEKLVWNIPFNGLGVAAAAGLAAVQQGKLRLTATSARHPCLSTDRLLGHPAWEKLVRDLMRETINAANALGLNLPASVEEEQVERTRSMGPYKASTLLDFERGQPMELTALFEEPLRQGQQAGVSMPRLEGLVKVLRTLAASR